MFCNRPGTVTNVSIPEKTSQNKGVKKMKERQMEPLKPLKILNYIFILQKVVPLGLPEGHSGQCRFWPVVLWKQRMGLCIAHGNGLSLSLLSHLTNQPLLGVYPRFLLTAVQMWCRGQDLGRSDTQPQHGVNKRQLLQCEWCWELLDKVFRTRPYLHTHRLWMKH